MTKRQEKLFGITSVVISFAAIFFTGWPTAHQTFNPHHQEYVRRSMQLQ